MYDDDAARSLLEGELADPKYQRQFGGPVREAIDDFLQWLQQGSLNFGGFSLPAGPLVVLVVLVAAVVVVLLLVRPRLQRSAATEQQVDIETGMTAEALRARADQHAQAGRYDHAARDRFRALVRAAEQRGLLPQAEGRTATEISMELTQRFDQQAAELRAAAELFNLSRYGSQQLSAQQYQQLYALDAQLAATEPTGTANSEHGPRLVIPQ